MIFLNVDVVALSWRLGQQGRWMPSFDRGPLIAATGFLVFGLVQLGGNYWRTLLSGFKVLGLGMTENIAPLATVVMSCLGQDRTGTASGIDNAVSSYLIDCTSTVT